MNGINLGLRNYYRVQPINIANSCNNEIYPKTHYAYSKKKEKSEDFKDILNKCIESKKRH